MLDEEMVYDLADLFKIFSDSTRLKILCSLFEGDLNVTEITAATGVSQTAVSHQLRILKQNHLVKYTREGKQVVYSLSDDHVKNIIDCGITKNAAAGMIITITTIATTTAADTTIAATTAADTTIAATTAAAAAMSTAAR